MKESCTEAFSKRKSYLYRSVHALEHLLDPKYMGNIMYPNEKEEKVAMDFLLKFARSIDDESLKWKTTEWGVFQFPKANICRA